jgi:hypothetical protein
MGKGLLGDVAKFGQQLQRVGPEMERQQLIALRTAVKVLQDAVFLASGKYAGKRITATNAQYLLTGDNPSALVGMKSRAAHLLNDDTKSHEISPGALTGRRSKSPVLANIAKGFGPVSVPVTHPGTKGKGMWEKALAASEVAVFSGFDDAINNALLKLFQ